MKKILVLVGSARRKGNTETLADAFIEGAMEKGHEVTKVCLCQYTVKPCLDCMYCYQHAGQCVLKDDMQLIYEAMQEAQVLVLASPIYFYNFSAQLKAVLDRLHNPIREQFPIKETVLLSCCADEGEEVFMPLKQTYQCINHYLGWRDQGMVFIDGVEAKGSIKGNEGLKLARQLGKSM